MPEACGGWVGDVCGRGGTAGVDDVRSGTTEEDRWRGRGVGCRRQSCWLFSGIIDGWAPAWILRASVLGRFGLLPFELAWRTPPPPVAPAFVWQHSHEQASRTSHGHHPSTACHRISCLLQLCCQVLPQLLELSASGLRCQLGISRLRLRLHREICSPSRLAHLHRQLACLQVCCR